MLLVGQGSVGKTSLAKQLMKDKFNPRENKTEGIDINYWQVAVDGQEVQLNVWDFGGQEIMHATHQFFLTKRSLYVLVLDARIGEDENRVEYWLKIIQSFGGESPIIVVGNKVDQQRLDIDQRGLLSKYPTVKAIIETSCKTGEGLEALAEVITEEVGALDHIHDELLNTWFDIKTRLEEMEENYISMERYRAMCEKAEVGEELSQNTLIGFLHDLGIVLNFQDDPHLQALGILNPEWATNGVYKILNNRGVFENKGVLERAMLNKILPRKQYPKNKHLFIMNMMRKFELCYDLDPYNAPDEEFLIPDLLPKEEPYTGEWDEALAFQYHYNVLPGSIITRFIVRIHKYVLKNTAWRTGAVLADRDNKALVKADKEDKKIFIRIIGPEAGRRPFLAIIRAQFDAIHDTISRIEAAEKVPLPGHDDIVVDYEHLLTLQALGEKAFIPSGLAERINVKKLLDGVETIRDRQMRRTSRLEKDQPTPPAPAVELEPEVFISYAWGGESEKIADQLDAAFQKQDITIVRDKRDLGFKGRIKEFMREIGRGKCVVVVISKKYLESEICMFELAEIAEKGGLYERIFPIVLDDAKIYKAVHRIKYIKHWEDQIEELDEAIKTVSAANLPSLRKDIDLYTRIRGTIDGLTDLLRDMNALTPEMHRDTGFKELIAAVEAKLAE